MKSSAWIAVLVACVRVARADDDAPSPPPPPPPPAPAPTAPAVDEALLRRLAAQDQAIAELGNALAAERQARLDTKPEKPPEPAVVVGGFAHIDAALRQSSQDQLRQSGDPLNQDRVYIRRGRPKITATYGELGGVFEIDVNTINGAQVRPSAFEVTYQAAPWVKAGIGIAKIPFGFEVEQSDRDRLFLERSNAERALFPGEYDVGAKVSGGWKFLRYSAAAQNGEPVGEKTSFSLRDPNQAKDITARFGIDSKSGDVQIAGGVSFLTGRGFHAGTPATKDTLFWKDLNENGSVDPGEVQIISGSAATPSASFDRFAVGADAELTLDLHDAGKLTLYGELVAAANLDRAAVIADPVVTGRDFRELGWYLAVVHEPTPWSAFGARYDLYNPDADANEVRTGNVVPLDQRMSTFAVTGALRHAHGRLILEYDHNRNHQGRTMAGVPTNLADDAVTLRAEVKL